LLEVGAGKRIFFPVVMESACNVCSCAKIEIRFPESGGFSAVPRKGKESHPETKRMPAKIMNGRIKKKITNYIP